MEALSGWHTMQRNTDLFLTKMKPLTFTVSFRFLTKNTMKKIGI